VRASCAPVRDTDQRFQADFNGETTPRQALLQAGSSACKSSGFGLTERPRSRTEPAVGYTTSPVLKTSWATGPVPLQAPES
jgi:hypothetical protein